MNEITTTAAEATVTQPSPKGAKKTAKATKQATSKKDAPKAKKAAYREGQGEEGRSQDERRKQVGDGTRTDAPSQRRDAHRNHGGNRLAASQRARVHLGCRRQKMGIRVESTRRDDGERVCRLTEPPAFGFGGFRRLYRSYLQDRTNGIFIPPSCGIAQFPEPEVMYRCSSCNPCSLGGAPGGGAGEFAMSRTGYTLRGHGPPGFHGWDRFRF
jgi:hypothetical protein